MGGRWRGDGCETSSIYFLTTSISTITHAPPPPPLSPRYLVIAPPQAWDRNFQLAFWSASIYLPILVYDNPTNPFIGWSYVAVRHTRGRTWLGLGLGLAGATSPYATLGVEPG